MGLAKYDMSWKLKIKCMGILWHFGGKLLDVCCTKFGNNWNYNHYGVYIHAHTYIVRFRKKTGSRYLEVRSYPWGLPEIKICILNSPIQHRKHRRKTLWPCLMHYSITSGRTWGSIFLHWSLDQNIFCNDYLRDLKSQTSFTQV